MKPLVAFTMGDPAGIGPEIAIAAAADPGVRRACSPLLVGSKAVFQGRGWKPSAAPILDPGISCPASPGRPSPEGGMASYAAVRLSLRLAARGLLHGLVTGPICKRSWNRAGIPFRDHTELLGAEFRSPRIAMMLMTERLRTVPATRHVPLREVAGGLRATEIVGAAGLARTAMRALGVREPRIAVCALNPHAGEGGLLGGEERRILTPAVRRLRRSGCLAEGPIAADAAWAAHREGRFDAVVTLYHDQALIPLKMDSRYGVVNWTLGIPFVRTSPGHGTAFDIAGKSLADPGAMISAALLAARLSSRGLPSWN